MCKRNKKEKKNKSQNLSCESNNISDIAELLVEEFRFIKSYISAVNKLYPEERQKYQSAYEYHINMLNNFSEKMKMKIVKLDGLPYDDGLSIKALNIEDFDKDDTLIIEQVIEPLIISSENGSIIKSGSVILKKEETKD